MDDERQREKVNEILTQFFICHVSLERAASKIHKLDFLGEGAAEDLDKARYHLGQLATHIENILTNTEERSVFNA